jgi:predicted  nucleic acid-binding Zn-ribbon protein
MQIVNTPATLYQDVMTINYILANKQVAKDKIISTNMRAINEYLNIVKTDVKELLASSSDRADTLDFFIDQLKYRHNTAIDNMKSLQEQITLLKGNLTASEAEIERIKQRMEKDFENFDS